MYSWNKLPPSVQIPNDEKKETAFAVCKEIDEMMRYLNSHYSWKIENRLDDLFSVDNALIMIIASNVSIHLNKQLHLDEMNYDFKNLTVKQFIDVVYADTHNLPLPEFKEPTLLEKLRFCFNFSKQKTRE